MDDSAKDFIRSAITAAGACKVGFTEAAPVAPEWVARYSEWISQGCHAEMAYLDRYHDVRSDPRLLLDGALTVISCAFDHRQPRRHPLFADYALGEDYHDVIRRRLTPVAQEIVDRFGGATRICVDTAPIRERYWAAKAGIGIIGQNGMLIVDGVGSKVFLAEILWTGRVEPDKSRLGESCAMCGACLKACPGGAIAHDGTLDARRCNSCLTIEHRGELPADLRLPGRIYGCDVCQDVCPLNACDGVATISEFLPREDLFHLDSEAVASMSAETYRDLFRHSAVRRAKLAQLQRNAERH